MKIKDLISNKGKILIGPKIITPTIFNDERGYFYESWNQSTFDEILGKFIPFSQDNHSLSNLGVIRGLHYQGVKSPQAKLLKCLSGSIFDVVLDIRKSSPTFSEWASIKLESKSKLMIWIPFGFAHGFLSMESNTEVFYKVSGIRKESEEKVIKWDDDDLNINWPLKEINIQYPILSLKDSKGYSFTEAEIYE